MWTAEFRALCRALAWWLTATEIIAAYEPDTDDGGGA